MSVTLYFDWPDPYFDQPCSSRDDSALDSFVSSALADILWGDCHSKVEDPLERVSSQEGAEHCTGVVANLVARASSCLTARGWPTRKLRSKRLRFCHPFNSQIGLKGKLTF